MSKTIDTLLSGERNDTTFIAIGAGRYSIISDTFADCEKNKLTGGVYHVENKHAV